MLEDRDYMREPSWEGRRWSLTTVLLVVNAVVFVVVAAVGFYTSKPAHDPKFLFDYFGLSIRGIKAGYLWQPITFQFLHAGFFHLLCNLITIYFFGRPVEQALGARRFLSLYFGSGMFGGLLQLCVSMLLPGHFGQASVVGASAGAFGLVAAFATLQPERPLTLLIFFIIPVSMRAKYLLLFAVLLAVFGIVVPMDNIAHAAHLGGILVGMAMARWGATLDWAAVARKRRPGVFHLRPVKTRAGAAQSWTSNPPPPLEELPPAEFISKEVDPILDKISAHGIQSLTPKERRILERASSKIDRR